MLNFYRITDSSDKFFHDFYSLYEDAFPEKERRSAVNLEYELKHAGRFCAHALLRDCKFVGLFNYWTFDKFYYLEHVAVVPEVRAEGVGTEAMQVFKSQTSLPVLFEVELPTDSTSIRRIHFYEKLGYSVLSKPYAQPPYDGDGFLFPMELMTDNVHFALTHYNLIKDTLYREVYHYEAGKESRVPNP